MGASFDRPAAQLFNNSVLSDVTIKQITKGKVREYHAHRAILSADSRYFLRAFTGSFKEASENVMEIHDDDLDHFEFLLKYIYTYNYDKAVIDKLAGGNTIKRVVIPIDIHAIADKYDVQCIYEAIAKDLQGRVDASNPNMLKSVIGAHYKTMVAAAGPVGTLLAAAVLEGQRKFMHTQECQQLILLNPAFGADVALALMRDIVDHRCSFCGANFVVRRDTLALKGTTTAYCSICSRQIR